MCYLLFTSKPSDAGGKGEFLGKFNSLDDAKARITFDTLGDIRYAVIIDDCKNLITASLVVHPQDNPRFVYWRDSIA